MTAPDRPAATDGTDGSGGTGSDPDTARDDRMRAHAEPTTNDRDRPPKPMTDETNPTEQRDRAATKSDRTGNPNRPRRRVKDRDHTSPVEGHARTFERNNEGRHPKTDGGRRRKADEETTDGGGTDEEATDDERGAVAEGAPTEDEPTAATDGRVRRRVKDRDHTSPVEGHKRTFERGEERTGGEK